MQKTLSVKQTTFVNAVVAGDPLSVAYQKSYGLNEHSNGSRLSKKTYIKAAIKKARKKAAKRNNITLDANLLQLQKIIKECITGIDVFDKEGNLTGQRKELRSAVAAIAETNKMLGFNVPKGDPIELPKDISNPADLVLFLIKAFSERKVNKDDVSVLLQAIDTMMVFRHGENITKQLAALGLEKNKNSIFNVEVVK